MVEFGKYKPLGNRGIVGSSRGVGYGLAAPLANMERANRESHLFVQIETVEGVKRCREIVAVEGISGAVIGPADLSVSMGKPFAFDDKEFVQVFRDLIQTVRSLDKIAIAATGNPSLVKAAIQSGAQIIISSGERPVLKAGWQQNLKDMAALIQGNR
jgi:2-keto-3-deoxy-L-rhamnonate aldolase RhmA